ncbi:kinase-like domain-containing protein [Spinellus fusiger]|nr:kinase-like domain-containing protein [Spinellus fusiger]
MHSRIPEQQSIGQTLPPVPVGIDTIHAPPLPLGAMPIGTRLQVGHYQVVIHNFIAEGGFAHVYLARIEGKTGFVVLKRVAVPDMEALKTVEKEIAFMQRLGDHKNITRYYESRIDILPMGGYEALILMEYCPGGGVIDLMNRRLQQRLTEHEITTIFSDVCEALAYMHYCNPPVLHRDLKVENILILSQDHYKLCDFGSASLSKGSHVPTTIQEIQRIEEDVQKHTTLQYRAPEMIDIYQKKPINEKADIWALGVLLYKLCYYTTPFEEQGQLATLNARYTIPSTPIFSEGLRHLICSMLQEDQNQRPNIYQVTKSVFQLKGIECPIRNIYHEVAAGPTTTTPLFENIASPQVPVITPMRRGRPGRQENPEKDPFEAQSHKHNVSLGFESDFKPVIAEIPGVSARNSFGSSSPSGSSKGPSPNIAPSRIVSPNAGSGSSPSGTSRESPREPPFTSVSTSILRERLENRSNIKNSPKTPLATPSPKASPQPSKSMTAVPNYTPKTASPKTASLTSMESRLQAIKGIPSRPKPPPKPARFRTTSVQPLSLSEFEGRFPSVEEL